MQSIVNAMRTANEMDESQRSNMVANISRVVDCSNKVTGRRKYAFGFLMVLFLNLANVVFNFWLMNEFLNNEFYDLGFNVRNTAKLVSIFPRMTICQWKQFGTGGDIEIT